MMMLTQGMHFAAQLRVSRLYKVMYLFMMLVCTAVKGSSTGQSAMIQSLLAARVKGDPRYRGAEYWAEQIIKDGEWYITNYRKTDHWNKENATWKELMEVKRYAETGELNPDDSLARYDCGNQEAWKKREREFIACKIMYSNPFKVGVKGFHYDTSSSSGPVNNGINTREDLEISEIDGDTVTVLGKDITVSTSLLTPPRPWTNRMITINKSKEGVERGVAYEVTQDLGSSWLQIRVINGNKRYLKKIRIRDVELTDSDAIYRDFKEGDKVHFNKSAKGVDKAFDTPEGMKISTIKDDKEVTLSGYRKKYKVKKCDLIPPPANIEKFDEEDIRQITAITYKQIISAIVEHQGKYRKKSEDKEKKLRENPKDIWEPENTAMCLLSKQIKDLEHLIELKNQNAWWTDNPRVHRPSRKNQQLALEKTLCHLRAARTDLWHQPWSKLETGLLNEYISDRGFVSWERIKNDFGCKEYTIRKLKKKEPARANKRGIDTCMGKSKYWQDPIKPTQKSETATRTQTPRKRTGSVIKQPYRGKTESTPTRIPRKKIIGPTRTQTTKENASARKKNVPEERMEPQFKNNCIAKVKRDIKCEGQFLAKAGDKVTVLKVFSDHKHVLVKYKSGTENAISIDNLVPLLTTESDTLPLTKERTPAPTAKITKKTTSTRFGKFRNILRRSRKRSSSLDVGSRSRNKLSARPRSLSLGSKPLTSKKSSTSALKSWSNKIGAKLSWMFKWTKKKTKSDTERRRLTYTDRLEERLMKMLSK